MKQKKKQKNMYMLHRDKMSFLEKEEAEDAEDPLNQVFIADETFRGPEVHRKITDIPWIYIFIVLSVSCLIIGLISLSQGKIHRIKFGQDIRSDTCGIKQLSNKPYLYFADPVLDINVAFCVSQCPSTTGNTICIYKPDGQTPSPFCYTQLQTKLEQNYCIPVEPINRNRVNQKLSGYLYFLKNYSYDLHMTIDLIIIMYVVACLISFIIQKLLFNPMLTNAIVGLCVAINIIILSLLAYSCYTQSQMILYQNCTQKNRTDHDICGDNIYKEYYTNFYIFSIVGGLYFLRIIFKLKSLIKGIRFLSQTTTATQVLEQIKILPHICAASVLFISIWQLYCFLMGFTVGQVITISAQNIDGSKLRHLQVNKLIEYANYFILYMLVYWVIVIENFQQFAISYFFSIWFFTKQKETVQLPRELVYKNILRYHMGTIFYSSLTSSFFTPIQLTIYQLRFFLRKFNQMGNTVRFFSACMQCQLIAFQKFFRYLSKNALVLVAMKSENLYESSKNSYFLIFRNQHIVHDLDDLQSFTNFQCQLTAILLPTCFTYFYLINQTISPIGQTDLSTLRSPFMTTYFIFFLSNVVSNLYVGSFDMTLKAILSCYLIDNEMFVGEQKYSEEFIQKIIDFYGQQKHKKSKSQQIIIGQKQQTEEDEDEEQELKPQDNRIDAQNVQNQTDESSYYDSDDDDDDDEEEDENDDDDEEYNFKKQLQNNDKESVIDIPNQKDQDQDSIENIEMGEQIENNDIQRNKSQNSTSEQFKNSKEQFNQASKNIAKDLDHPERFDKSGQSWTLKFEIAQPNYEQFKAGPGVNQLYFDSVKNSSESSYVTDSDERDD